MSATTITVSMAKPRSSLPANPSLEDVATNERFLRGLDACETVLVNLDSSASALRRPPGRI